MHNFHFDEMYALFGMNSFSLEIMVVHCLGLLEGLTPLTKMFPKRYHSCWQTDLMKIRLFR